VAEANREFQLVVDIQNNARPQATPTPAAGK